MSNKILGVIAMAFAPFLCIDFLIHGQAGPNEHFEHSSLSGVFNLVFMVGWMCSILVLQRIGATGYSRFGVVILYVQMATLVLANVWNVFEIVSPGSSSVLYAILDMFWPISQVVMLLIGITVVVVRGLPGWRRFVPLMAGLWFPVTILLMVFLGQNYLTVIISGVYAVIAWGMMGWVCYEMAEEEEMGRVVWAVL